MKTDNCIKEKRAKIRGFQRNQALFDQRADARIKYLNERKTKNERNKKVLQLYRDELRRSTQLSDIAKALLEEIFSQWESFRWTREYTLANADINRALENCSCEDKEIAEKAYKKIRALFG